MLKILNLIVLVPWKEFEPGMSFFIPCLDRQRHCMELKKEANRWGYEVICKPVVENGKYGLRLWRVQ
jgi:hypothetical protein